MALKKIKLPDNSVVEIQDSRISGIDSTPTSESTNVVTSGGVAAAISNKGVNSTDTSSKIFLVGATAQVANAQTYSDNEIYATNGVLTTKSVQVGGTSAAIQYNSTDKSIEFIFS